MIVVKVGGCNGSGKSTVVNWVRSGLGLTPIELTGKGKVLVYGAKGSPYKVLGDYTNACGGMDTITDKEVRLWLLKRYARDSNIVVFEGLIASKAYGATGELAAKQKGKWLYAFMDTPFEVCVKRVLARRKAAGNNKPFDPERTMRETFHVYKLRLKAAMDEGHRVLILNHKLPPSELARTLMCEVENML